MKPRTRKFLAVAVAAAWLLAPLPRGGWAAGAPTPEEGKGRKKKKEEAAPSPSASKGPKDFPFPILLNHPISNLKLPDMDAAGKVLSMLMAQKATRIDDDRVQMKEMRLDLNKPDGKEDYHVVMPTSILNIKTHMLTSDEPVSVRTQDFELTGEKMEFNTVEREGRLVGNVRMVIHNLKQLAGQQDPTQKSE